MVYTLAISEQFFNDDGTLRAVWIRGDEEIATRYSPADSFLVTGADASATHLVVIERSLAILSGWQIRVSVIPLSLLEPGSDKPLRPTESFALPRAFPIDNFEAVVARNIAPGKLELLLLSDDNFTPLQRTLLLQIELDVQDTKDQAAVTVTD